MTSTVGEQLNVCMFGKELAPSEGEVYIGGATVSAVNLCEILARRGVRVRALSARPRDWTNFRPRVSTSWGEIHVVDTEAEIHGLGNGLRVFSKMLKGLTTYCYQQHVDLIHGHSGYSVSALVAVIAGQILRVPVVHSLYCPLPDARKTLTQTLSVPPLTRLWFWPIRHVFAMSRNVQRSLEKAGYGGTVSWLPPYVDTDRYTPDRDPPDSVHVDSSKWTVLYVGNYAQEKGLQVLVRALDEVREELDVQFIYTTERSNEWEDENRRTVERLLTRHDLTEHTTHRTIISDMPELIAHADVLVVPFLHTHGPSDYPLVVLEAMASGTPVIGSDVGGIRELLEDGRGVLVEPDDVDALSDALRDVHRRKVDVDTRMNREYVQRNFSEDVVAQQVLRTYKSVCGLPDQ